MKVKIAPSIAKGSVNAPPSKSMAHRALIAGALTDGSEITNISYSKDILATLSCLEALGARVERNGDTVKIGGLDPFKLSADDSLFCNESGSTLRFLIPMCFISGSEITLKGAKRLFERPLSVYENIANEQNFLFSKGDGYLTVKGALKAGTYTVPGNISSQFITGLLYALPLLDGDSRLIITDGLESASYIDLTFDVLDKFGICVSKTEDGYFIKGNQTYKSFDYTVEGDCSNAAFLEGLNLLGGNVEVSGISPDTKQGDRVYKDMYSALKKGQRQFDLSDCPDLGPVMFAVSSALGGAKFTGTARLKIKESDRAAAMSQELKKFGIDVLVNENDVIVHGGEIKAPKEILFGHNDHRIVMSLSLLCTLVGGEIDGSEAVSKSYPDFFEILKSLQIGLDIYET